MCSVRSIFVSGHRTDLISNDLFSDHSHKFDSKIARFFERWQQQHQHIFTYDEIARACEVQQPSILYIYDYAYKQWTLAHIPYTDHPMMTSPFIYTGPIQCSFVGSDLNMIMNTIKYYEYFNEL